MHWGTMPEAMRRAFCCPVCQGDLLEQPSAVVCAACGSEWPLVAGQVPCFAQAVYASPQAKTVRTASRGAIRRSLLYQKGRDSLSETRAVLRRLILRDESFWEVQLGVIRTIEERVVAELVAAHVSLPVELALELGVGLRDKTGLYDRITRYAICSDVFIDEQVATPYGSSPSAMYSVINASQLPLREGSVDLVLTSHVIEHFPDKPQALNNIRRVLKPGGWACHVVPTAYVHIGRHLRSLITNPLTLTPYVGGGVHGEYDNVWSELTANTVRSWRQLFESEGFVTLGDTPGMSLALRPFSASVSNKLANTLQLYGSHVFLTHKADV